MSTRSMKWQVCLLLAFLGSMAGQPVAGQKYTTVDYPGAAGSVAVGLSQEGVLLGRWQDAAGYTHGFLMVNGKMAAFDCAGAVSTSPNAMNSGYEVVGTYQDRAGKWTGFYLDMANPMSWDAAGGKCVAIDPKGSVGRNSGTGAIGISEAGEIAGWYDDAQNNSHGFIYRGGVYLSYDMVEGASAASMGMSPLAMSPQGELIGHMQVPGSRMRGWFLHQNKMHVLDFPPGDGNGMTCGFAVNSKGEIAGHYQRTGEIIRGMVYRDGAYTSLEVPNAKRTDARGISEDGTVVGFYTDQDGKNHGFILQK